MVALQSFLELKGSSSDCDCSAFRVYLESGPITGRPRCSPTKFTPQIEVLDVRVRKRSAGHDSSFPYPPSACALLRMPAHSFYLSYELPLNTGRNRGFSMRYGPNCCKKVSDGLFLKQSKPMLHFLNLRGDSLALRAKFTLYLQSMGRNRKTEC